MDQKFEPLNPDDIADLEAKRTWVGGHYEETKSQTSESYC
jgi:hypothetical protein